MYLNNLNPLFMIFRQQQQDDDTEHRRVQCADISLNTMVVGSSTPPPLQVVLGTSAYSPLKLQRDGRVPMADRKSPLSQFRPKSLLLSVSFYFLPLYFYMLMLLPLTTLLSIPIRPNLLDLPSCSNQYLVNSFNLLLRSAAIRAGQ